MNITHKFAYSLSNFSAYKEFIVQGLRKAIFYMFLVTLVFSTLGNIRIVSDFNDDMARVESKFNKESPDFEYKDGKLTMDYDGPLHYRYDGDSSLVSLFINTLLINNNLIVDTSGKTNSSVLDSYDKGIFLDSDSITIKNTNNYIETKKLEDLFNNPLINSDNVTIDKSWVSSSFTILNNFFDSIIFIVSLIISFLSNLFLVFFFLGPLTIILSKNLNVNLTFKSACTIGFYAISMPLLLKSLLVVAGIYNQQYSIIFYIIGFIYCYLALKSIKESSNTKINTLL